MTGLSSRGLLRRCVAQLALCLAGVTAVSAMVCIAALSDPTGIVASSVRLAPVEEVRAQRLLAPPGDHGAPDVTRGRAAALAALSQGPTRATAWLDLAYAETLKAGFMNGAAQDALRRSWIFEPFGPDDTEWRIRFAFEHWGELAPDLRQSAMAEAWAQWKAGNYHATIAALSNVGDPAGRLAAALLMSQLERQRRGN